MKIKTCLLAALMGITSSFSIVLAIETPKGWQSGGMEMMNIDLNHTSLRVGAII